jgi:hypothetical protein
MWVSAIMKAFSKPYNTKPTLVGFEIPLDDFRDWQETLAEKTKKWFASNSKLQEAVAVVFFNMVVQRHEARNLQVSHESDRMIRDGELSCSMRLKLKS